MKGYKWCDWIVFFWYALCPPLGNLTAVVHLIFSFRDVFVIRGCALTLVVALTVPETFSPVLLKVSYADNRPAIQLPN
jgi:hypothetical protein